MSLSTSPHVAAPAADDTLPAPAPSPTDAPQGAGVFSLTHVLQTAPEALRRRRAAAEASRPQVARNAWD